MPILSVQKTWRKRPKQPIQEPEDSAYFSRSGRQKLPILCLFRYRPPPSLGEQPDFLIPYLLFSDRFYRVLSRVIIR